MEHRWSRRQPREGEVTICHQPVGRAAAKGTTAGDECGDAPRRDPVSAEERQRMIATAAYLRAERRGFAPGHETEDWLEAEADIDRRLACG